MDALTVIASIWTIWAQSTILEQNGEFDRFKQTEPVVEQQPQTEIEKRRQEIIQASVERRKLILARAQVLSQTDLGER